MMLARMLLLGAVVCGSICMGSVLSGREREQTAQTERLIAGALRVKNALQYQKMSLAEAFLRAGGEYFTELSRVMLKRPSVSAGEALCAAGERTGEFSGLCPEARELWGELAGSLFHCVTPEDAADAFELFERGANEVLSAQRERCAKRCAGIRSLCAAGGLALAIILI